ncbi:transcription initiation factor IIB [Coemansia aciculifera]|uniref:Transcription initiation factor IIB n=1 Tax=Coemansia aciculifera TaxID=417176 RepID=A0A9W8IK63_9FUNG|nr:transcription initiation factor IIB [Coemansia aciculifera]
MLETDEQQPFDSSEPEYCWNMVLECPYCRNKVPNLVEDFVSGDYICSDCGLVLDRVIDTQSEWLAFANEERNAQSRVGNAANPFLDGAQLDTLIAPKGDSSYGLTQHLNRTQDLNHVLGHTTALRHERNLVQAYKETSALCGPYNMLNTTIDIAKQLYRRAENENLLQGKNKMAIIAACIFLARRQDNASLSFKEICAITNVDRKDVARTFKFLKSKWDMDTGTTSSNDLVARFCANLNLDRDTRRIAEVLSRKANDMGDISGKSPVSIASACIYLSSHLMGCGRDAKAISEIAGVGETTIRAT